jgi:hypothetical protein
MRLGPKIGDIDGSCFDERQKDRKRNETHPERDPNAEVQPSTSDRAQDFSHD